MYIAIEGIVGCGKTTVLDELEKISFADFKKILLLKEPIECFRNYKNKHNPLLNSYQNPHSDSAICQLHIINELKRYYTQHFCDIRTDSLIISERCHLSPLIFTKTYYDQKYISHFVHDFIVDYWSETCSEMPHPDLIIFLDVDTTTCQKRIVIRDRLEEGTRTQACAEVFQSILRKNYLLQYPDLSKGGNFVVLPISSGLCPHQVAIKIAAEIIKRCA